MITPRMFDAVLFQQTTNLSTDLILNTIIPRKAPYVAPIDLYKAIPTSYDASSLHWGRLWSDIAVCFAPLKWVFFGTIPVNIVKLTVISNEWYIKLDPFYPTTFWMT